LFEVYRFNETEIALFALMLIRISSCIAVMPIFGIKHVPAQVKVLLALLLTFVLFPVLIRGSVVPAVSWREDIILLVMREAFLGLFMGFLTRMIFIAVEVTGQLLGFSMGFSAAQLVNPASGEASTVMEQFETVLATLLFLSINGHHMLLEAIYRSFDLAPLARLSVHPQGMLSLSSLVHQVFVIGLKLAAPMIAVILFLNIALGVVGRAVPQINVFVISFPINIMVGLFVFIVSIPMLLTVLQSDFVEMGAEIFSYIKGF
jgi:flagellar biosynthetic protein FliR